MAPDDPIPARIRHRRAITGMSAVLLPHTAAGAIDWPAVEAHIARTAAAGTPVNAPGSRGGPAGMGTTDDQLVQLLVW